MKKFIVLACFVLSGCGTINVRSTGAVKQIGYVGFMAAPGTPEVQNTMMISAQKECPNGYQILSQSFSESPRSLTWKIKCN